AGDQGFPRQPVALAAPFGHKVQSFGRRRQRIRLAADRELAFERRIELGRHDSNASRMQMGGNRRWRRAATYSRTRAIELPTTRIAVFSSSAVQPSLAVQ